MKLLLPRPSKVARSDCHLDYCALALGGSGGGEKMEDSNDTAGETDLTLKRPKGWPQWNGRVEGGC